MALGYAQQTWTDGTTPVDAAHMSHIEAGVGLMDSGKVDINAVTPAATVILNSKLLAGDAQPAWQALGNGALAWGPGGSAATDATLQRVAVKTLGVGYYSTPTYLTIYGDASGWPLVLYDVASNAYPHFYIDNTGGLHWGPKTAATDTNLYRSAASALKTDGSLAVGGNLTVSGSITPTVAGPQGPAGPTGATGPTGPQGATGPTGPAGTALGGGMFTAVASYGQRSTGNYGYQDTGQYGYVPSADIANIGHSWQFRLVGSCWSNQSNVYGNMRLNYGFMNTGSGVSMATLYTSNYTSATSEVLQDSGWIAFTPSASYSFIKLAIQTQADNTGQTTYSLLQVLAKVV